MERADYQREVVAVVSANAKIRKLIFAASRAPTLQLAQVRVETIRMTLTESANRLDALAPPEDAADANELLVAGLRELEESTAALAAAAEAETLRPLAAFADVLTASPGSRKVEAGIQKLEESGYSFRPT
ncbi:MAG TPA: hypothetical protein VNJ54_01390 [Plantibacter sp.]|uniref:hypothetical protein n=1 Tax=Plantibacter sp. TaxID=1871045 RepID=UPI002B857E35|nr:hypothetical protein [Plantibacter sp.]